MTVQQLEKEAFEYAQTISTAFDKRTTAAAAYIAGAHSRDEEITLHKERADYYHDLYMKLLNPWISVEERLPEKIKNKGVSKYVFVTWPDGTRGEAYYNYEEYKAPRWEIKGAGIMKPAYWMPIPELTKGE